MLAHSHTCTHISILAPQPEAQFAWGRGWAEVKCVPLLCLWHLPALVLCSEPSDGLRGSVCLLCFWHLSSPVFCSKPRSLSWPTLQALSTSNSHRQAEG